jgi:mono/diheme cytochrome c family protein
MIRLRATTLLLLVSGLGVPVRGVLEAGEPDAATGTEEFFEARVRPVLAENCFRCHGEERQRGGLRLDSPEALLRGRGEGPVVVAGDPERSPMIHAVLQDGQVKMPPKGKLSDESIQVLIAWVKMGAPWPAREASAGKPSVHAILKDTHWAFQPIRDPPVPEVRDSGWCASPIDRFILQKLEEKEIPPAPRADRRDLIRRVTFDLTGVPPTPEEVQSFVGDQSPDAFAKVVDRLLASPRYGERWGRYWLDVARYSDTKGYVFEEERRFPYSYTYRDYVIRSFNEDLPYDRFILEQLAADLLPLGEDKGPLAAMGFLTLGRRFLNNKPDIIDDRIDVVSRGLMGLTVTCARCHDHKYDPIPTADYYSLYGVFASAGEPKELPLIAKPVETEAYAAFKKELEAREGEVAKFFEAEHKETLAKLRKQAGEYLVEVATKPDPQPNVPTSELRAFNRAAGDLNALIVRRWRERLKETAKGHHPVFAPWHAFAAIPAEEFAAKASEVAARVAANELPGGPLNPLVAQAFAGDAPPDMKTVAERYGALLARADAREAALDAALEEVRNEIHGPASPASVPLAEAERHLNRAGRGKLNQLRKKTEEWKVTSSGAPPRAMSLEDGRIQPQRIFIRGNAQNQGEEVPRRFLDVLTRGERKPFAEGSGRLELARAIASSENPLTARVIANRVWTLHFGAGLVRTPGDFGARSDPPTHPELLDHLASRLIEGGWSLKKLHRAILLSSAYQQSADGDPGSIQLDPENRLAGRANRRRLDFEAMRDAVLAVAGALDLTEGGPAVDIVGDPSNGRRTVYGFIDRQNLPSMFRTFDFASPDTTSPQRYVTSVPQQALFLMNSPFIDVQARRLAARPDVASRKDPGERVETICRLAYGRAPTGEETALALRFLEKQGAGTPEGGPAAWARFAQAILLSNEFQFLD